MTIFTNFSAKAIQSVIQLKSAKDFRKTLPYDKQIAVSTFDFETEHAQSILNTWKKEFTEYVNKANTKGKYRSKMLAFSRTSFQGLIDDFSHINKKNCYVGLACTVRFLSNFYHNSNVSLH